MACPYAHAPEDRDQFEDEDAAQKGVHKTTPAGGLYGHYLALDTLLNCQNLASKQAESEVHDEHLFIITHQAYELWFKQILHELDSVRDFFEKQMLDDENKTLLVIRRLNRITLIMKVLVEQFTILETMTSHEFLDFRHYLSSGSGFQSLQFRLLENKLGLKEINRVRYNQKHYKDAFKDDEAAKVDKSVEEPSLLELVEKWLEYTPGLEEQFGLWEKYKEAAQFWIDESFLRPAKEEQGPEKKEIKMANYQKQQDAFDSIADAESYNVHVLNGNRRFSYRAFQGAVLVSLYQDEPRYQQPFQILTQLMDIDSMLTKWRHHHVIMVQRMIGNKLGTGGSSGYLYLRSTVSDRYKVFLDLFNLPTYLIPRSYLPPLNADVKRRLSMVAYCKTYD